jgi:cell division septal protein FtsQ
MGSIVTGFLLLYFGQDALAVREIEVTQKGKARPLVGLDGLEGDLLPLIRTEQLEADLRAQNPYVRSVSVEARYPGTLLVTVDNYTPAAYLQGDQGYFILAGDGRIVEKTREAKGTYPVIVSYQKPNYLLTQAGESYDLKEVVASLRFLELCRSLDIDVKRVDIAGFHMIRLSSEDKTIVVSAEKDVHVQSYQLETLVRELRRSREDFSSIDVRFDKPVYVPANPRP